jgi:hypothetical protein
MSDVQYLINVEEKEVIFHNEEYYDKLSLLTVSNVGRISK